MYSYDMIKNLHVISHRKTKSEIIGHRVDIIKRKDEIFYIESQC